MGGIIVEKKFSEKELLEIANSGLADLSCEQIKQLIKKESEKDYEQLNTDFIDLCFDVLAMKHDNKPILINEPNSKIRLKKNTVKKVLVFAAVIMMFCVTTITVSASVFHFNIPKEIASFIKGNAEIDYNLKPANTSAEGYALVNSSLAKKLDKLGLSPVTLPEEMIKENCTIQKIENISNDVSVSTVINIEFEFNNSFGRMAITKYLEDNNWTGENTDMDVISGQMIKVNGLDVLVFEHEDYCTVQYKDNKTIYNLYLENDLDTTIKFVNTIK